MPSALIHVKTDAVEKIQTSLVAHPATRGESGKRACSDRHNRTLNQTLAACTHTRHRSTRGYPGGARYDTWEQEVGVPKSIQRPEPSLALTTFQ